MLGKVEALGPNRFSDYLTRKGLEGVRFRKALNRFQEVLSQFSETPIGLKENPTTLFEERVERDGIGPLIRSVKAYRDLDITLIAQENDLSVVQPKDANNYWAADIRAHEIRLSRGEIQWIKSGSYSAHNNVNNKDADYVAFQDFKEKEMETKSPELKLAMGINEKTEALNFFIKLLTPSPTKEKPVKKSKGQIREENKYANALNEFNVYKSHYFEDDVSLIRGDVREIVNEVKQDENGNPVRRLIYAYRTEDNSVILEASEATFDHHVHFLGQKDEKGKEKTRDVRGKSIQTFEITFHDGKMKIKAGKDFAFQSEEERLQDLATNFHLEPAINISTLETIPEKTKSLKTISGWLKEGTFVGTLISL